MEGLLDKATWLTPDLTYAIERHAREAYPNEALGVLTPWGYQRMDNEARQSERRGRYNQSAMHGLLMDGNLWGIAHSHTNGMNCPSEQDMRLQKQLNVPAVIACTDGQVVLPLCVWGDMFAPAPLEGRGFQHGVTDCYEAARDWYLMNWGVRPPSIPRNWRWWEHANLVDALSSQSGYIRVNQTEAVTGDLLWCAVRGDTPNHALLYLGGDEVLNHSTPRNPYDPYELSGVQPLARWLPYVKRWLRPDANNQTVWGTGGQVRGGTPL